MLCAAEGGLKGAHAEEWVSLGALSAISMALEVRHTHRWLELLGHSATRGGFVLVLAVVYMRREAHDCGCIKGLLLFCLPFIRPVVVSDDLPLPLAFVCDEREHLAAFLTHSVGSCGFLKGGKVGILVLFFSPMRINPHLLLSFCNLDGRYPATISNLVLQSERECFERGGRT